MKSDKQWIKWRRIKNEEQFYSGGHYLISSGELQSLLQRKRSDGDWEITNYKSGDAVNMRSRKTALSIQFFPLRLPDRDQPNYIMELIASWVAIHRHRKRIRNEVEDIVRGKSPIRYRHL
ncbi:MAG: hypothetical protein R3281_11250 [Balneolaceae bacterium]|nr:hypothetical protein [Balneolaceae bacterium]